MTQTFCRICGCTYQDGSDEAWDDARRTSYTKSVRPCPVCQLRKDMSHT